MTRNDLVNNLGTIAKSGTAEFFSKLQDSEGTDQVRLRRGLLWERNLLAMLIKVVDRMQKRAGI